MTQGPTKTRPLTGDLAKRAQTLEWVLCDVDGVLTDGRLYFDGQGEALKAFNVRDGLGLRCLQQTGIKVGLLSARSSAALDRRAENLSLDLVLSGRGDKDSGFDDFIDSSGCDPARVAYIGDDLNDLVVLARCGLGFAPADAADEVRTVADVVLRRAGGNGAVREMCETLLKTRGDWQKILGGFSFE